MAEPTWFKRLGDVPGVEYATPSGTRPLKAAAAVPHVAYTSELGTQSVRWTLPSGEEGDSPVRERTYSVDFGEFDTAKVLRHLAGTLELPGEPVDYHFALQGAISTLWGRRRAEPDVFAEVERLGLLDVGLIEACPVAAEVGYGREGYLRILAFGHLVTIYEREGAWADALRIATIATRFEQLEDHRDTLAERVAQLQAEAPQ